MKVEKLPILGLVGGIGSGKSFIAHLFGQMGAIVLEADRYAHDSLKQPEIKQAVREHWGPGVFTSDGEVDRKSLGHIVFSNPVELKYLEKLIHPWIECRIWSTLKAASKTSFIPLAVLDAAIMLETGWDQHCHNIVFVDAPLTLRLQRIKSRGWDETELKKRECTQWPLEKKREHCKYVIHNDGNEASAREQVRDIFESYARG